MGRDSTEAESLRLYFVPGGLSSFILSKSYLDLDNSIFGFDDLFEIYPVFEFSRWLAMPSLLL
jgi:hypothetical protein